MVYQCCSTNDSDPFEYLLVAEDGNEIGNMIFMDLAAGEENLKNVIPSPNELLMKGYAGIALPKDILYEHYVVQKYEKQIKSSDWVCNVYAEFVASPYLKRNNPYLLIEEDFHIK